MSKVFDALIELEIVFKGIAGQYTHCQDRINDAVQMLYEYFLNMNRETLNNIYERDGKEGLIKYSALTIRRYFTSKKNRYYSTYTKYYDNLTSLENVDYIVYNYTETEDEVKNWEYYEQIDQELDKMYWYDKEIYKLYYSVENKETLDTLAKKTGISRNSLFNTIDNVRKILKEVLSE
jgi:DNA-binding phage protein